jgi:response regulator RpfG family c-di-GMP phosphodiesterase
MSDRILFVDDDANVLSAIRRTLRRIEGLHTAQGADEGMRVLREEGPFAIVISDQQMPGTDGVTFLRGVKKKAPDTVRMMLTGNADQKTAVDAVRESEIFRFLNKPCSTEDLTEAIAAGLAHHRLINAERELLQNTLAGSVKLLLDVMTLRDPHSFEKAARMRRWAKKIAPKLQRSDVWMLDLVAMLWSIGEVALPVEIASKIANREKLTPVERQMVEQAPMAARDLLLNVPRLKPVAEAVYYQNLGFDGSGFPDNGITGEDIPFYGRILRILKDLATITDEPDPVSLDFDILANKPQLYDAALLAAVREALLGEGGEGSAPTRVLLDVSVGALRPGDIIADKIVNPRGILILAAREELTAASILKLEQFARLHDYVENVKVLRLADQAA